MNEYNSPQHPSLKTSTTDRAGKIWRTKYNPDHSVKEIINPQLEVQRFKYDVNGNLNNSSTPELDFIVVRPLFNYVPLFRGSSANILIAVICTRGSPGCAARTATTNTCWRSVAGGAGFVLPAMQKK